MSVSPCEYTESMRRQSRPKYEYPAAYNGLRTEGTGWDDYLRYRENFDKSWEDYRREDDHKKWYGNVATPVHNHLGGSNVSGCPACFLE